MAKVGAVSLFGTHLALGVALTSCAGVAIVRLGVGMGLLRERQTRRRCQACGRSLGRHGCEWCGY